MFVERRLRALALGRDMPVLGICHGMQVLGEALGGTIARGLPLVDVVKSNSFPGESLDRYRFITECLFAPARR